MKPAAHRKQYLNGAGIRPRVVLEQQDKGTELKAQQDVNRFEYQHIRSRLSFGVKGSLFFLPKFCNSPVPSSFLILKTSHFKPLHSSCWSHFSSAGGYLTCWQPSVAWLETAVVTIVR